MPLCSDKDYDVALKKLADQAEHKRQHSSLTCHLKSKGLKNVYDKQDIAFRREYFRKFVGNKIDTMAQKEFQTEHNLKEIKNFRKTYEMMTEYELTTRKGPDWTAIKLKATAEGTAEKLEHDNHPDPVLRQYKIYKDMPSQLCLNHEQKTL